MPILFVFGILILGFFLPVRAGKYLDVISVIALGEPFGILEFDLDHARQRGNLANGANAVGGFYRGVYGGRQASLLLVGLLLVAQTAHKSATVARDLGGIEREILLLCHLNGHLTEIGEEACAAKGSAANAETADKLCLVTNTDLTKLDTGAEHRSQVLNKLAEIHSAVGGKVEEKLGVIEGVLRFYQLHVQLVDKDLVTRNAEGFLFFFMVLLIVENIFSSSDSDNRAQGRNDLLVGDETVGKPYLTEFRTSCRVYNGVLATSCLAVSCGKVIDLTRLFEADADYLGGVVGGQLDVILFGVAKENAIVIKIIILGKLNGLLDLDLGCKKVILGKDAGHAYRLGSRRLVLILILSTFAVSSATGTASMMVIFLFFVHIDRYLSLLVTVGWSYLSQQTRQRQANACIAGNVADGSFYRIVNAIQRVQGAGIRQLGGGISVTVKHKRGIGRLLERNEIAQSALGASEDGQQLLMTQR